MKYCMYLRYGLTMLVIFIFVQSALGKTLKTANNAGWIELIIEKEKHEKCKRLIANVISSYDELTTQLTIIDSAQPSSDVTVQKSTAKEAFQKFQTYSDDLSEEFKHVYIKGRVSKEMKQDFRIEISDHFSDLERLIENDFKDRQLLSDIIGIGSIRYKLEMISNAIEYARIKNDEQTDQKLEDLTVWEWLFGF